MALPNLSRLKGGNASCLENVGSKVLPGLGVDNQEFYESYTGYPFWNIATFAESKTRPSEVAHLVMKNLENFCFFKRHDTEKGSRRDIIKFSKDAFKHEPDNLLVADTEYGPMRICWYDCNVLDSMLFDLKIGAENRNDATNFITAVREDTNNNTFVCAVTIDVFSAGVRLYGTTVWQEPAPVDVHFAVSAKGPKILQEMLAKCPFYGIQDLVMAPGSQMADRADTTGGFAK